jgi:hypothetical protein
VNISFKTESLTSAFDSYNAAQAKLALQAESDRLTLIAVEKANALTKLADEIIERALAEEKALSVLSIAEEQKKLMNEEAEVLIIMAILRNEMVKLEKNLTSYKATSPNSSPMLLFPSVNPWVKSTLSVRMLPVQEANRNRSRELKK